MKSLAPLLALACLLAAPSAGQFLNIRVNSDTSRQLHNEEQICVNPTDSNNVVAAWRDFRLGYRRIGAGCSFDGGRTWHDTLLDDPHWPWHSDPGVTVDADGNFYVTLLSFVSTSEPNGLYVQKSTDGGRTWGPSVTVVESVPGVFEDKQLIACDRGDSSPYRGNIYCTWTRFYATQVMVNRSTDGNLTWGTPLAISDGSGSRQWPTPAVGPDGTVYVAWCHLGSPLSIRIDRSTDGGATWGTDRTVQAVSFGSGSIQPGIQVFSFPALDVDISSGPYRGRLYCAYMDREASGGANDIWFTRSTDNGATWSARRRLNDDPLTGRDQFHPWLCVDRNGDITATWYDRREDPANTLMHVYLTQSLNGGDSWTRNERVTTVASDPNLFPGFDHGGGATPRPLAGRLGEYNGLWAVSRDNVFAMWADTRDGSPNIYVGIRDTASSAIRSPRSEPRRERLGAAPNPFSRAVRFSQGVVVCDASGRRLADVPAGAVWQGTDRAGRALPAGIYVAILPGTGERVALVKSR